VAEPAPASPDELGQLRNLLVGPELEQFAQMEARVSDPARRTVDIAQVLPEAIRGAKARALREALEPVFEKAFSSSVRKNPRELADAIYPIIGPAIRTSIAAAIRDFAEALNQIVEKSASLRSVKWRVESIISGKPFTEILLARSLLYSVEQVFLIHRKSGLLLQHVAAKDSVLKDADMISGMLTAIQDFLSDSFTQGGQDLETVDTGRFKLWLTYSPKILLVAAVSGTAPAELRQVFRRALDQIDESLQSEIAGFKQDDVSVFEPARPVLEACLLGQSAPERRKKARLWPYFAALAAIVIALIGWRVYTQAKWNRYFEALRHRQGIVVTSIEKGGPGWVVTGLEDPLATEPVEMLRAEHLDPRKVVYIWTPYLSLNTPFALKRESDAAIERVSKQIVRFETNSAKLVIAEADRIDDLTQEIGKLLRLHAGTRIRVAGHADDTGNPGSNEQLSTDRASMVADALVAQGIPRSALEPVGLGNTMRLREGITDWDRSTNRGVSFQVELPKSP
jgi:outer membrane protein OmpA-like peptidoglycan-associated protein